MTALTAGELDLLRSYAKGRRIWDATAILPGVFALARKGLIEPAGTSGAYQLTEAGREALEAAGHAFESGTREKGQS
jgi:hypothetical protein